MSCHVKKVLIHLIYILLLVSFSFGAKPNIVFVLADDYGFNDIGYHGKNHLTQIKTPCLDS